MSCFWAQSPPPHWRRWVHMPEHSPAEIAQSPAFLKGLRVALVVPSVSARGGSERQLQSIMHALRDAGAAVTVFSASASDAELPGVEVRSDALRDSMGPWSRVRQAGAVAALADEIVGCSDVVEFQRIAPTALCRNLTRRLPTVLSVYTAEHTCPSRGRYLRRSSTVCDAAPGLSCLKVDCREQCLCFQDGRTFSWRDRVRALLQQRRDVAQASVLSLVTFNSRAVEELYSRFVGKPHQSRVIAPPLEAGPILAAARSLTRLVFAGRIEEFKGVFDLIPLIEALESCTLEVIGDGAALPTLREQVRAQGLEARVRFHGWLERDDVAAQFASAAICLVPSRCYEAWAMVGPEAIAQGCPVVAYDNGGIAEWCLPKFGTRVRVGDVQGLVAAARHWLAQRSAGLDTSSWREEAQRRWGMPRFLREYADALSAAMVSFKAAR